MIDRLKPTADLVKKVLTEIKEPPMKGQPQATILRRFVKLAQFETFHDPDLERMFKEAQRFAASINHVKPPYWLTLAGKTGTGKTHLAQKVWRQFMDQNRFELQFDALDNRIIGNTATWVDWRKFCQTIRDGGYDAIDDLCKEWFVVIDDIGSVRDPSGFVTDALDRIIAARKQKWTLITTNYLLKEVAENLDVRIADRMLRDNSVVVEIADCASYTQRVRQ